MSSRNEEVNGIINRLNEFKADPDYRNSIYAIDENIAFLNSIRTIPRYVGWLYGRGRKLDGSRLLELTDFPVPEWDVKMHERLIDIQRRDKPGLVKPLVNALVDFIEKENRPLVIVDLGSGGMEIERQIVTRLSDKNFNKKLIIVGVDKSPTTQMIAKKNLAEVADKVELIERNLVDETELNHIGSNATKNIVVVLCKNDIFELDKKFGQKYFDAVYHSLFRHHLGNSEQEKLDNVIAKLTSHVFEYDGFRNLAITPLQTLVGWNHILFLDAEIFSNLRFKSRDEIKQRSEKMKAVTSYNKMTGFYLLKANI